MYKKVTAILLRAKDLRDYDKSVHLFSAEEGLIIATMRGVRRATAKLKFACQPFAFCEYELSSKGNGYIVTGANTMGDFFSISASPEKYFAGMLVCEAIENCAVSADSATLFIVMAKTLKAVVLSKGNLCLILAKFLQKLLSVGGFLLPIDRALKPDTPDGLLSKIAMMTMDEVELWQENKELSRSALRFMLNQFERETESKLKSKKLFLEIV